MESPALYVQGITPIGSITETVDRAGMDTKALRYFQTVAEFGGYSRGAEFLRLSQPALSRQIKRLEEEVGTALFFRHGHGITLTDAGRTLLACSQAILRQMEQVRAEIREDVNGPAGTVSLAVPPAAGTYLIPALAARFAAAYPNVFLKVVGGYSGYIHEWLVRGQVDLACIHDPLPQRGFDAVPLVQEPVFLVGRPGSFPRRKGPVCMAELATLPMILPSRPNASRRLLDRWMAEHHLALNLRMEVDDPLSSGHYFGQGGASACSAGAPSRRICERENLKPFRCARPRAGNLRWCCRRMARARLL